MSIMNFGYIRDLVSNLGWKENENAYTFGTDCLDALEQIECELLNEDVINRSVYLSLNICGAVKNKLIPILQHGKNKKPIAVATRVLVNLTLPAESLSPVEEALFTPKTQNIRKQLYLASFEIKKTFLDDTSTFPIVAMLREAMIKSKKHNIALNEDDCVHLKNCLILLQNILSLPEELDSIDKTCSSQNWQDMQNKLIWNLFVQGVDGALLLMLNSKYRVNWTVPLTHIIVLLYKNQNLPKVHDALELISSASDTSCDEEESDGSKNSSISLSSEPCKTNKQFSDSGCALASDTSTAADMKNLGSKELRNENTYPVLDSCNFDIHTKLEKVQISDASEHENNLKSSYRKHNHSYGEIDSGNSSCGESPHHKKIKGSSMDEQDVCMSEGTDYSSKKDSGVMENMDCSSSDVQGKSSDDGIGDKKSVKNFKAVQKLRSLQNLSKVSESDSSNEDIQNIKIKYRSHPPAGRRGKSPRRNNGCTPFVCMDSAIVVSAAKGRLKYPLWEKRNSVTFLVDTNSVAPSDEDIGNLIKEFTMSFLHSGFSYLVQDLKNLLLDESVVNIDKSLFFWVLSYFLHLASAVHLNIDHISNILNVDVIGYLVFECILSCENLELHLDGNTKTKKHIFDQLRLIVTALKEMIITIDMYSKKANLQKDKLFFLDLYGKIAELQHLQHIPLLLLQNCDKFRGKDFVEDVVLLNHYILAAIGKGIDMHPESNKSNLLHHLKHFSSKDIICSYGSLLENYKNNSNILNECLFTMMHHIAGDLRTADSLIEPSILKSFSSILKEDYELEPYQEDLIVYILNKFSLQVQKKHSQLNKEKCEHSSSSVPSSSSNGSDSDYLLSEEDDDLFWWYLQFEQDKDPIARISEHISISKRDILSKLQLKGIISPELHQNLEAKMKSVEAKHDNLLSCGDLVEIENFDDEITHLLRTLVQSGWRQHLTWVQESLLEACYVKLGLKAHIPEPVPYYSIKMKASIPIVPYTQEQRQILKDEMFLQLLKKIGFYLGYDACPMYPRIPLSWSCDVLFTIAARLGPMRKDKLKFSYEDLLLAVPNHDPVTSITLPYPELPPLSSCCTLSSWLTAVQKSKETLKTNCYS